MQPKWLPLRMHGLLKKMGSTKTFLSLLVAVVLLCSCAHRSVVTTWRATNTRYVKFNRILVAALVQDTSLALRRQMEQQFVADLKGTGYNALSAMEAFGPHGLANLPQEETFQKLRSKGIDAVLTIALLDKRKETRYVPARVKYYSSLYYYNRIWDYKKIEADLANKPEGNAPLLWECILFDLNNLQPLYTAQTRPFDATAVTTDAERYGKKMVSLLLKNKLLAKQLPVKAF